MRKRPKQYKFTIKRKEKFEIKCCRCPEGTPKIPTGVGYYRDVHGYGEHLCVDHYIYLLADEREKLLEKETQNAS